MIPISSLPTLPNTAKSDCLALLFEPCATLVDFVLPLTNESHSSWPEFIESVRAKLLTLSPNDPRTKQIIAAHPRLGAAKVDSTQSQSEQKSLGDPELLAEANFRYEQTFPNLRYVVFVNHRPRAVILADMNARILENNYDLEVNRALNAMCDIALDREKKL